MSIELCSSLKSLTFYEELKRDVEIYKVSYNILLSCKEGALTLSSDLFTDVSCDFLHKKFIKEVKQSYGRADGVFEFLNKMAKQKKVLDVCDLTVGMGKDLFKFALAGHNVVGFERNPIFYYLVKDGVERFLGSEKSKELQTLFRVEEFLIDLRLGSADLNGEQFDLLYYDPMFEDQSKKAAPKKGMQALKYLSELSSEDEKMGLIKELNNTENTFVYKCSKKSKDFPFVVKKETKGKGFSYLIL